MAETSTIAFVGLGKMGAPMVRRLAGAGHALRLFDVRSDRVAGLAGASGGVACGSATEAAQGAAIAVTMLPNAAIVRAAALDDGGLVDGLGAGAIVVDMSSSFAPATQALGAALAERGLVLLDAPVSGGVRKAEAGTLAIMLGGDEPAALQRAEPVLAAMGTVFRTGPLGSGHALKALNNYVSAAGLVAACEALLVGRAFGLDPAVMVDVLNASTGRNNSTEVKLKPFVLSGSFDAGFAMDLMAKDLAAADDLARELDLDLALLRTLRAQWARAARALGPGADHTEIFRFLEAGATGR